MKNILFLLFIGLINPLVASLHAQETEISKLERATFDEVNKYRAGKGKPALVWNDTVYAECAKHSKNMALGSVPLGHDGGKGRFEKLSKTMKIMSFAENVAMGQTTAEQVTESWINSKGHRKNIEGNYTTTAVAIVVGKDGRYWFTQIFVSR